MSNLTTYQRQDLFETELASSITASATSIIVANAPSFTLSSGSFYATIDPTGTPEIVEVTAMSGTTLTVTRGVALYEGAGSSAAVHAGGVKVLISNNWKTFDKIREAIATKFDTAGGTFTGPVLFSGASTYFRLPNLTTTQRTALTAANGMEVYDTDLGAHMVYIGGVWTNTGSTTVSNASETVAGKVEEATQNENDTGASAGASADLFATPAKNAATIQKNSWLYAADAGASDAYAITLTPAIAAYVAGMSFYFKANTANTGAATLNINGLGAIAIKKNNDQDLATGDIEAGQIVHVAYDGTNFQLLSAPNPLTTKGDLLVGTGSGGTQREAVGTDGFILTVDSAQASGIKWAAKPGFATGQTSRAAASGTGTQNIAHGLGSTPRYISITATATAAAGNSSAMMSFGTATSISTDTCIHMTAPTGSLTGTASGSDNNSIIKLEDGSLGTVWDANVSTLDATNITLDFTTVNASGGTCYIQWTAHA